MALKNATSASKLKKKLTKKKKSKTKNHMDWDLSVSWTRTIKTQTQKFKNKIKNTPWKLNFQLSLILTRSLFFYLSQPSHHRCRPAQSNHRRHPFSLCRRLTPSLTPSRSFPLLSLSLSHSPSTCSALLSLSLTISFDFCEIWVWNWWKLCRFCGFFLLSVNMGLLYLMNCYGFFVLF